MDHLFASGGEMGALMSRVDWSRTSIGPPDTWPQALRTATSICLESRFPILVWWGERLTMLYNDAYRPMLGQKHPRAMGQDGAVAWADIWDVIGPMLERVRRDGEATWSADQLLVMDRYGYLEETYFTFSYSPIRDDDGAVAGVFTAVSETTEQVIGTRRLALLRALAGAAGGRRDEAAFLQAVDRVLARRAPDLAFAVLYLLENGGTSARRVLASGARATGGDVVDLAATGRVADVLTRVAATRRPSRVDDLAGRFSPDGAEPRPVRALALPVRAVGADEPLGVLVAGLNPRRPLDTGYEEFLELAAATLAGGLADARASAADHERAEGLAALSAAKTEFFSNVSHEFRTPLTLLLAPLEEALGDPSHPVEGAQRERLETARRNALRLRRLVNSLLDFSRSEAGGAAPQWQAVDLARLTEDLAGAFRAAVETAGLELRVEVAPLAQPVVVDPEAWEKIVLNLISNAFKHTLMGSITVALRDVGHAVELRVADTGTGIPEEDLPRLFERFHRVQGATGRSQEGTGIGLALVGELVGAHGGEVAVDSRPGGGAAFTVRIPHGHDRVTAEALTRPSAPAPVLAEHYVADALVWSAEAEVDAGAAATAGGRDPDRPRVLLVDDNADLRAYVGRLLSGAYTVEAVPDGERALARATADPPDLVLSDVMMPGLDGLGLLRALRADERTARIPVVLLSARAGTESSVEALDAGADDYLVKPFSAAELLARVRANVDLGRLREHATRAAEDRYDREHALVEELQRSLLPEGLPLLPEVEVAADDLPAEGDKAVGGDWYDVLRLPDERIMLVVGDVVGHGMQAAATMAHLRTATRAYAGEGHGPGELVHRVSRLVERTGVGLGSTLLLAVLDADSGALEYASAGHPPALVAGPSGARWLAFGLAPPLGLSSTSDPRAEQDVLGGDETLVLFTDGLVERRGEDLEDRLRQLAAVPATDAGPAALIEALVHGMTVEDRRDDDVVVLAARRVPARATLAMDLGPDADLAELRDELRAWLGRADVGDDVRDEVLLVACEAVINAIEHSGADGEDAVAVRGQAYDDRLRLVVRDHGRWRRQGPARARGHGLRIIRALMDEVALDVDGDGTRLEVSRELSRP